MREYGNWNVEDWEGVLDWNVVDWNAVETECEEQDQSVATLTVAFAGLRLSAMSLVAQFDPFLFARWRANRSVLGPGDTQQQMRVISILTMKKLILCGIYLDVQK